MRAHEFISEGKEGHDGKIPADIANAMPGVHKTRDHFGYDRTYHLNRMGMAMAAADGKSTKKPEGVDAGSWSEKFNTVHPYTKEEENMLKQAMKIVPTEHETPVKSRRSIEADDTHKISPVNGFKGWK